MLRAPKINQVAFSTVQFNLNPREGGYNVAYIRVKYINTDITASDKICGILTLSSGWYYYQFEGIQRFFIQTAHNKNIYQYGVFIICKFVDTMLYHSDKISVEPVEGNLIRIAVNMPDIIAGFSVNFESLGRDHNKDWTSTGGYMSYNNDYRLVFDHYDTVDVNVAKTYLVPKLNVRYRRNIDANKWEIYNPNPDVISLSTEKKVNGFKHKNTPKTYKFINIYKFGGNYSKITNIDSDYMSYPLNNNINYLRKEVA